MARTKQTARMSAGRRSQKSMQVVKQQAPLKTEEIEYPYCTMCYVDLIEGLCLEPECPGYAFVEERNPEQAAMNYEDVFPTLATSAVTTMSDEDLAVLNFKQVLDNLNVFLNANSEQELFYPTRVMDGFIPFLRYGPIEEEDEPVERKRKCPRKKAQPASPVFSAEEDSDQDVIFIKTVKPWEMEREVVEIID
jgi:hypothetical protein